MKELPTDSIEQVVLRMDGKELWPSTKKPGSRTNYFAGDWINFQVVKESQNGGKTTSTKIFHILLNYVVQKLKTCEPYKYWEMRGKKPKRSTTPPSEDEGDDNFVADPDQIFDDLPQPFRLVDKTLRQVFDDAWEIIEGIEERKALKRSKAVLPLFELGKQLSEYNKSTCVCTVTDGGYLFLSYSNGLAVVDSLLGTTVACFEDPGNSIVQISACCLQEGYYLISTLDSVGKLLHATVIY